MGVATEIISGKYILDRGDFGRKYIDRRGLEGLVVARIIAFTWIRNISILEGPHEAPNDLKEYISSEGSFKPIL